MKLKYFFSTILLLLINVLNGQYVGEVIYQYHSNLPLEKHLCGETMLFFGKDSSIYVHLSTINNSTEEIMHSTLTINSSDNAGFPIYINKADKKFQQKVSVNFNYKAIIHDVLKEIKWEVTDSFKTNSDGLKLVKAKTDFGGRNYIVWFCPDIPYDSGPFKLWGLPGLILEAETVDGSASIKYKSINLHELNKTQINTPNMGQSDYQYSYFNYCNSLDRFEKELLAQGSTDNVIKVTRPKADAQLEIGFKK